MTPITNDYYQILEVAPWANQTAIETAYRHLALLYHPDLNYQQDSHLKMQLVNEAYSVLRHPLRREKYDRDRGLHHLPPRQPEPWATNSQRYRPPSPPIDEQRYGDPLPQTQEQVLLFFLDHTSFGLNLRDIEGVLMMHPISPDPLLPYFIEGIISARGAKTPVIDLRRHLGIPSQPVTKNSRIILTAFSGLRAGLIVDSVENNVNIPTSLIDKPPFISVEGDASFIRGIAKQGYQLIILLELPELFSLAEKEALFINK
jgi:purine-binding chemotaxis protein CheW